MSDVELKLDYIAVGVWLKSSPELRARLDLIGQKGLGYARSIAPVGTRTTKYTHPGQYRDSLYYKITEGRTRMNLTIGSRDFTAWWIEYGSKHNTRHSVLRRTLDFLRSGSSGAASSYTGMAAYDAANKGTQRARSARRARRGGGA